MSNNKITTIRIDEDILETIRTYSEIENESQTDFINSLLESALSEYFIQRSGGAVMTIPNPQLFNNDVERYENALQLISEATIRIGSFGSDLIPLLHNILAFYSQRLFADTPEDVEKFKKNHVLDSTQCDTVAKNNN